MAERWVIERIFVSNGWELFQKTKEETVLCKNGEEIYVSDDSLDLHPYDDYVSITVKLKDIEFKKDGFETTKAEVRVTT